MSDGPLPPALAPPRLRGWLLWLLVVLAVDAVVFWRVFDARLPFNYTYKITPKNAVVLRSLLAEVEETWPNSRITMKAMVAIKFDIGRQAIPTLVEYAHSPKVSMRRFSLYALGALGDQTATPTVMEALDDPQALVVFSATMALGNLGDPLSRDRLLACLDHDDYRVRASGALNLGLVGPRQSDVPVLIAHIEDPHPQVGKTIQNVLSQACEVNPVFLGRSRRLWEDWWTQTGRQHSALPLT